MACAKPHFLATTILLLGLLAALDFAGAQIGACYGRNGNPLPNPPDVVALYNRNNIKRMRLYDPHQPTLQALRGSNIELILGVPNTDLQNLASSPANASNWVQNNVRNYGNVNIKYIAVGNEVSPIIETIGNEVSPIRDTAQYTFFVLPAMMNIFNAISAAGLANHIKVSTAVETGLVTNSYPPSKGEFRGDVKTYINPIIQFLQNNSSPLLVNIYPYFAHIADPRDISLDYALFRSGVDTPDGRYGSLFDALLDATYSAVEKAGGRSVNIVVSESGWPTAEGTANSIENARTYNQNLIRHVLGTAGTPKRPGRSIETYIFAIFDENQKAGAAYEQHFGLFYPNGQMKYPISLRSSCCCYGKSQNTFYLFSCALTQ